MRLSKEDIVVARAVVKALDYVVHSDATAVSTLTIVGDALQYIVTGSSPSKEAEDLVERVRRDMRRKKAPEQAIGRGQ